MREINELTRTHAASLDAEEWGRRGLQSLPAHVAVLEGSGTIVLVNRAWNAYARTNGAIDQTGVAVGANYLDVCRRAADANDCDAQAALTGLRSVLDGAAEHFAFEYGYRRATEANGLATVSRRWPRC
jgi:hypothetical protein